MWTQQTSLPLKCSCSHHKQPIASSACGLSVPWCPTYRVFHGLPWLLSLPQGLLHIVGNHYKELPEQNIITVQVVAGYMTLYNIQSYEFMPLLFMYDIALLLWFANSINKGLRLAELWWTSASEAALPTFLQAIKLPDHLYGHFQDGGQKGVGGREVRLLTPPLTPL